MNPEHAAAARQAASDAGKQVGQWLEEAITEKQERDKEVGNVTTADCVKNWGSARSTCLKCRGAAAISGNSRRSGLVSREGSARV